GTGTGLFTYAAVPTVTAISPTSGPAAGGTAVTITGTNFTGATSVTIGGVAATGIAVVNATTITATAPAGTAGAASIVVTTPGGISTEASLFTYIATPTVTGISPSTGPTAGGTGVTITGTNLTGATSVTIGGAAATSLSVVNATTITATTPAGTAGAANVAVTTPGGTGTGTGLFTYAAAPTVTGISPSAGPTAGGTTTTITGANFTGATAVTIGGVAATGVTVVNATTITATTPAGTAGAANVAVTTPGGTGTGTGLFTYFAAPTVTGISPSAGPIAGGTAVTITGTNFTGATAVTIGGAAATSISVVNATTITATTPAGTAGAANVTVTTPGGTDTGTSLFTYAAAPIVTAISPTSGPVAGGTAVTITGTNFTGATAVTIGGAAATSLSVVNATTITATAPGGTAGVTNVVVTTPGGTGTGTGLFTYFTVPILPAANIRVNNQSAPHKIVLIFSENLAPGTIGTGADWTVTANGGTPIYSVATVALANGNEITLTLNAVDLSDPTTYITNGAVNDHIKVTPPSTLTNTTNHAYATGQVTEAGATHTLDTTAPTLAAVGTSAPTSSGGTLAATASEIAKGYWIAVASGATAPTPAQIKAAVAYGGVTIVASGSGALPGGAAGSITLNGLADSTGYDIHVMAEDAAGNATAAISSTTITTAAPPAAPSNSTTTLPTGGGAASPLAGQTVVVTDNGKEGSSITLPTKTTSGGTTSGNAVNVTLPGTGTVSASSSSEGTKLGVTSVTLPGATAPVSTVTVDQGSASFTATKSGQAVAGLKNGIVVVSGSDTSQVSVDTTGTAAKIGIKSSDTIVVPSGAQNVSGTSVDLPAPDAGSAAKPVSVKIGSQEISVQAQQSNTTMTFKVIDIDGVKTPVVEVTGTAQVSSSGDNQPIVSISGNVVRSGTQKCNTVVQASSATGNDAVQVMTCYVILDVGSFSALKGGNGFAAIKDGIVWAGETAEFDKSGKVVAAYLGSKEGTSAAVGDDIVPGGGKFTAASYRNSAFIPRLAGTPLRLNGAKLDESIFKVLSQALGAATIPATPSQSAQGVLSFQLGSDQINAIPTRRIRVDTSRADGVSVSTEGNIEVAGGGLVTIFAPSVGDPQVFAAKVAQALPGAASEQRWNGSWKIAAADGTRYVGRPAWNSRARSGDAAFVGIGDNVLYNDGSYSQMLVADFDDYTTLQTTFANELGDARLTVVPRLDGTALATVNGKTYTLAPQWKLLDAAQAAAKPAWWVDGGMVYIKNADGTAQGFSVM
ncbi:MAG: IPT/TIG domain-containing protein, partial [Sulfuricella sp.]|nr:IPT/TIG domain-containing protein [Sulfuricella sp.]